MAWFERKWYFSFTFSVGHQLLEKSVSEPVAGESGGNGKEYVLCIMYETTAVVETSNVRYSECTMTNPTPIDITNIPELVRIAEEVEATK